MRLKAHRMSQEINDYLDYVQNVLGGKIYLKDPSIDVPTISSYKVTVLAPLKPSPQELELLEKILSAIQIQQDDFTLQTWDASEKYLNSEVLFIFGAGIEVEHPRKFVFPTLAQLSAQPELKKDVWNQIKHLKT